MHPSESHDARGDEGRSGPRGEAVIEKARQQSKEIIGAAAAEALALRGNTQTAVRGGCSLSSRISVCRLCVRWPFGSAEVVGPSESPQATASLFSSVTHIACLYTCQFFSHL